MYREESVDLKRLYYGVKRSKLICRWAEAQVFYSIILYNHRDNGCRHHHKMFLGLNNRCIIELIMEKHSRMRTGTKTRTRTVRIF